MYRLMTPIAQRQLCGGTSGWAILGLAAIAKRPAKHSTRNWFYDQNERSFHWRDR
jgi:hypothetical protein